MFSLTHSLYILRLNILNVYYVCMHSLICMDVESFHLLLQKTMCHILNSYELIIVCNKGTNSLLRRVLQNRYKFRNSMSIFHNYADVLTNKEYKINFVHCCD